MIAERRAEDLGKANNSVDAEVNQIPLGFQRRGRAR